MCVWPRTPRFTAHNNGQSILVVSVLGWGIIAPVSTHLHMLLSTLGLGGAQVVSVITSDMGTATPILLLTGNTSMIAASCQSREHSMPESTLYLTPFIYNVFVNIQWPSGVMAWRLESLAVLSDFITTWWGTFNLSPHCTPTPHYGSIT